MDSAVHQSVLDYNWDDGLEPIWALVESPETERATALLIYWRLGGPAAEGPPEGVNAEARRLQALVKERLVAGHYPPGESHFDPATELSRVQIYQHRKAGVPEVLLAAAGPK